MGFGRDNAPMNRRMTWIAAIVIASGAGCSPTLDWREFVPAGTELGVKFPCRPDRHARTVLVAGASTRMDMLVCTAGDSTYALSFFDVADPLRVSTNLAELRATSVSNLQGRVARLVPLQVKGATASEQAVRVEVAGRLPDGAAVLAHAEFFSHGLRVYQATVIGAQPPREAVETFFGGLKFPA